MTANPRLFRPDGAVFFSAPFQRFTDAHDEHCTKPLRSEKPLNSPSARHIGPIWLNA
jgi:hypothetical protein